MTGPQHRREQRVPLAEGTGAEVFAVEAQAVGGVDDDRGPRAGDSDRRRAQVASKSACPDASSTSSSPSSTTWSARSRRTDSTTSGKARWTSPQPRRRSWTVEPSLPRSSRTPSIFGSWTQPGRPGSLRVGETSWRRTARHQALHGPPDTPNVRVLGRAGGHGRQLPLSPGSCSHPVARKREAKMTLPGFEPEFVP